MDLYKQLRTESDKFHDMLKDRAKAYWDENYESVVKALKTHKTSSYSIEIPDENAFFESHFLDRTKILFPQPFDVSLISECDCDYAKKNMIRISWGRGVPMPSGVPLYDELRTNYNNIPNPPPTLEELLERFSENALKECALKAASIGERSFEINIEMEFFDYVRSIFPKPFNVRCENYGCIEVSWK
jgi:hypothetical protein